MGRAAVLAIAACLIIGQAHTSLLKLPAELGPSRPHQLTKQVSADVESDTPEENRE